MDLNGDGLTDILYPVDAGSGYVHWWVIFANGGGTPVDTHITTINNTFLAPPILGTFSGTRQTQVLLLPSSPS